MHFLQLDLPDLQLVLALTFLFMFSDIFMWLKTVLGFDERFVFMQLHMCTYNYDFPIGHRVSDRVTHSIYILDFLVAHVLHIASYSWAGNVQLMYTN